MSIYKRLINGMMSRLNKPFVSAPPSPGIYHFQRQGQDEKVRMHLRVEDDSSAMLMVNASRVYHLNPTAAFMAYLTLQQIPDAQVVSALTCYYRVSKKQAQSDYEVFSSQFNTFLYPNGACPIHDLGLDVTLPFSSRPSAPYRMDLALTYRCNNDCSHCYNARPRRFSELKPAEWFKVLDKLWGFGIPHVVFTGGEPTLFEGLPELVSHAEKNGQITGINTNGRRLKDMAFLNSLVSAGLDHIQVTLESHNPEIHDRMVGTKGAWRDTVDGLKNALQSGLFVMTNTTLLQTNSPFLADTLKFLADLGVPTVGLNALIYSGQGLTVNTGLLESELPPLLNLARQAVTNNNQRLIWYTPTQYCHFDPVQLDLGVKGCTAALYNMCIEPDGSVLPCQSYYQSLGNILTSPWEAIWNHDLSLSLRERRNLPQECTTCTYLIECGGGCPLARQARQIAPSAPIQALPIF